MGEGSEGRQRRDRLRLKGRSWAVGGSQAARQGSGVGGDEEEADIYRTVAHQWETHHRR